MPKPRSKCFKLSKFIAQANTSLVELQKMMRVLKRSVPQY